MVKCGMNDELIDNMAYDPI